MRDLAAHLGEASLAAFAVAAILTWVTIRILKHQAILDQPNARSLHVAPTPRGGGWAILLTVLPAWLLADEAAGWQVPPDELPLLLGAVALMAVSWADDRRSLSPRIRLAVQIAAVGGVLAMLPRDLTVSQGLLPLPLDRLLAGLIWIWFVNLFNFMDGIDGLAGGSAAAMAVGVLLVSIWHGDTATALRYAVLAAASLGFLLWNWRPAKIFLGDVGSVPMGYLLGFGLLRLAMAGEPAPALIIPLYYLADATITLLRRLLRGERVWQAHREHFYQQAVQAGRSHARVAAVAIAAQLGLVLLALNAILRPWLGVISAVCLVMLLLRWMARPPGPR